jgi:serine/threonine protein kinase
MAALTPSRAVAMMRQILLGLQHAHARGVIHRDLKLSNVMLVEMTGTEDLIKILDFGLARVSGVGEEHSLTDGMIAGTPSYMSPEQALGKKTDLRTDIYSAGVMLYVLATGKRPFVADGATELLRMQVHEAPPPPRKQAPQKRISEALERVILRALQKKPADRFQNVTEFVAALDDTPEGQETLTPTVARDRKPLRARWRLMLVAAAACIALGAAGALWARAYFLKLRSQAVGAYEHWATDEPATGPQRVRATELPDPPKPQAVKPETPKPEAAKPVEPPPPPPSAEAVKPEAPGPVEPQPPSAEAVKPEPQPQATKPEPPKPEPPKPEPPKPEPPHAKATPPPREWRDQIDGLLADGKINSAKNQLRDRVAVDKSDAWSHLRLGDVYADGFHYRRDAFREWDSALAITPALKSDAAFKKSVCETVDGSDRAPAQEFLRAHFDADETAALLAACVRAATEPARIENAAALIESVAGADRPELGMAALRMLDVGKTCAQKKAAVETIRRLRYLRARPTLVKLDRLRLAHPKNPPAAVACFGTTLADAIEQLK